MKTARGGAVFPPLSQRGGELAGATIVAAQSFRDRIAAWRAHHATGGDEILSSASYINGAFQDGVRNMYPEHPLGGETRITPLALLLNIVWLVLGGALAALGWFLGAFLMIITIIGIPWARAAIDNGVYTLWPFGARTMARDRLYGDEIGTGPLGFIGNIIWFVLAGWWLALGHLIAAAGLAITIIGLPFAWAHLKLAGFALWPIGRTIVSSDLRRGAY